ncbi:putative Rho GTPase activating protein 15 [Operophtera brumata]|uniref:Putative Rho GTPase activating protein 15 n=1 Tax=Operophtera brumata TaxID=104452 RepID=A0A0L7LDE7_OPEBR|nr:putative Rho GTPase activating protein 15 [Operophtera brumata]
MIKKASLPDEPVFGRDLEEVCPATSPRVPEFVVACVTEIEREPENMCTDGLYRASGNLSQVQKIRLENKTHLQLYIVFDPDRPKQHARDTEQHGHPRADRLPEAVLPRAEGAAHTAHLL